MYSWSMCPSASTIIATTEPSMVATHVSCVGSTTSRIHARTCSSVCARCTVGSASAKERSQTSATATASSGPARRMSSAAPMRPASQTAAPPTVIGSVAPLYGVACQRGRSAQRAVTIAVRIVDDVYGGLLRSRGAGVDADIERDRIGLLVRPESFVLGHEAAGPRLGVVPAPGQLVLVVVIVVVHADVGLFFGQPVVERVAVALLLERGAVAVGPTPAIRRDDPDVERIVDRVVIESVGGVEHAFVLDVVPLF